MHEGNSLPAPKAALYPPSSLGGELAGAGKLGQSQVCAKIQHRQPNLCGSLQLALGGTGGGTLPLPRLHPELDISPRETSP